MVESLFSPKSREQMAGPQQTAQPQNAFKPFQDMKIVQPPVKTVTWGQLRQAYGPGLDSCCAINKMRKADFKFEVSVLHSWCPVECQNGYYCPLEIALGLTGSSCESIEV